MLRTKCLELKLTQVEVARKLSVTRTFIVRTEQQERRLDVLELYRLLRVYGMKMADVEAVLAGERR